MKTEYTENKNIKLFIDFDGTITKQDVGEHMFLRFGDAAEANHIINRWIAKEITSTDTWNLLCNTVQNFNADNFEKFLNEIELDPGFYDFLTFCSSHNLEIFILSDGLDYYINRLLQKHNLNHLVVFCNELTFDDQFKLIPHFPYTDEECDLCANCKRNHIINNSSENEITIYIGDGYSDTCPAQFTDFIFAKNSLLKYCEVNRISYYPFENFSDVQIRINEILKKKRLKKRHQAVLKRKEVYQQG